MRTNRDPNRARRAYVFRLYPTPAQETALLQVLDTCRAVYNSMAHWRKHDYELFGRSPSYYEQKKALPVWKQSHPQLREVHSQTLQDVVRRVDLAFQAFFRRVQNGEEPGYPRRKGEGVYDSFTFTQGGYSVGDSGIRLFRIGAVKAVFHRPIQGTIKTLILRKRGGKWFACFSCEVPVEPLPVSSEQIGIDVGLTHFATLSDGSQIPNPRFLRQEEKALAKAQRKMSRFASSGRNCLALLRGTKARRKARKVVSRVHERIRNRHHNFVHQTTRRLVNRYGFIAVENLNVKGLLKNHCLSKSIHDAAWNQFRSILSQKAESAARTLVEVEPAYTSQDCSNCGYRVWKRLSERVHSCPHCGLVMDRDHNAAVNILSIAVGLHGVPVAQDSSPAL